MLAYIAAQVDVGGVFHMRDDKTGEMLALKFVKIHDPVRQIDGDTYFACTDFHVVGDTGETVRPRLLDGRQDRATCSVRLESSQGATPVLLYGWYKQPRYTFVDDRIVSLY